MTHKIRHRRQPHQLILDGLFVALLLHFFVTGSIVPGGLVDLFREKPQIVASTEPAHLPGEDSQLAPQIEDGDSLPETRHPGRGALLTNL